MGNSIQTAVRYLNNDAELAKIYESRSFTNDWLKPNVAVGAKTVKYRQVSFGPTTLGDFDRESGYTRIEINSTWVEKTLTQDKSNSLMIDKMDSEEDQLTSFVRYAEYGMFYTSIKWDKITLGLLGMLYIMKIILKNKNTMFQL